MTQAWENTVPTSAEDRMSCNYSLIRAEGYQYIKPLMFAEKECPSDKYNGLKADLISLIDSEKKTGLLTAASVYVRIFQQGDWLTINENEHYNPGALMNVPLLFTYLQMAESHPALLSERIADGKTEQMHSYKELLYYMIAYADTYATTLLANSMYVGVYNRVFETVGLNPPDRPIADSSYKLTVKEYSQFMKGLYNGVCLSNNSSEYAASILDACIYAQGITKYLPKQLKVINQYAEIVSGHDQEMHESAIIYLHNAPYILTIMTRGTNSKRQSDLIGQMSKMVYDNLEGKRVASL